MISTLEKEITFRFLKARKKDGFLNVISIFSFIGISLGVAVLIIVMTIIRTATPRLIPIKEKIDITFKKPSFFLAFKNLKVISFSNVEINLKLFVLL